MTMPALYAISQLLTSSFTGVALYLVVMFVGALERTPIVKRLLSVRSEGLVYGMGHAVYTVSDPRAVICKKFAERLAVGTEYEAEFELLKSVERLAPEVILKEKGTKKDMCANVDMYSGFVYSMMGIPEDLFTPLFACARMSGWACCA